MDVLVIYINDVRNQDLYKNNYRDVRELYNRKYYATAYAVLQIVLKNTSR